MVWQCAQLWILSPALYYSGDIAVPAGNGLAVWPGGLNIYTETGAPYQMSAWSAANLRTTCNVPSATFYARDVLGDCAWSNRQELLCHAVLTMWLTMVKVTLLDLLSMRALMCTVRLC